MGNTFDLDEKKSAHQVAKALRLSAGSLTIFVALLSASTFSSTSKAANSCEATFDPAASVIPNVVPAKITEEKYRSSTLNLRATLSGKLATVWRSEWKTKLQVQSSNNYVLKMVKSFLTPETQASVLNGLDPAREEFVRSVHERMFRLQEEGRLKAEDELLVRDPPAPAGATDRTFTYYTKPIVSTESAGKHQIRVRTYLREIQLDRLPVSNDLAGYDMNGRKVTIKKTANDSFDVAVKDGTNDISETMTSEQLHKKYGTPIYLFAPHGKNFKLEVKTALTDEISSGKYPLLGGPHMVQKLDMNLSMRDVAKLFSPIDATLDVGQRTTESLARLRAISESSAGLAPDVKARMDAVLNVLADGIHSNPDFLRIEGATLYHRTAFESKSGFQTTIDREQGVFAQNMYGAHGLKSPAGTMTQNSRLKTGVEDARHVELKVPVTVVAPMLGIQFHIPPPALPASSAEQQVRIQQAIEIYYPFVQTGEHSGKFNYLLQNHSLDDH